MAPDGIAQLKFFINSNFSKEKQKCGIIFHNIMLIFTLWTSKISLQPDIITTGQDCSIK